MIHPRRGVGRSARLLTVLVAVLAASAGATAARADPDGPPAPSVIGDGNLVGDADYVDSANPDPDVEATAGAARDDACTPLVGAVSAQDVADYQRKLRGETPRGDGTWRYVVCAETAQRAGEIARRHAAPGAAKAFCANSAGRCAVVVVWDPADRRPQRREQDPPAGSAPSTTGWTSPPS